MYSDVFYTSPILNYFYQKTGFVIQCQLRVVNCSDRQKCDLTLLIMCPVPKTLSQHSQRNFLICAFH